jgi:hypothetical protein
MTVLEKLHKIEEAKCIYDIHYCKAGVGILFYEPPEGYDINVKFNDSRKKDFWRKYLNVDKYYPTFEEMIEAEYARIV